MGGGGEFHGFYIKFIFSDISSGNRIYRKRLKRFFWKSSLKFTKIKMGFLAAVFLAAVTAENSADIRGKDILRILIFAKKHFVWDILQQITTFVSRKFEQKISPVYYIFNSNS